MKKSTMFLSILVFLMLFGVCGTIEVGLPPKEKEPKEVQTAQEIFNNKPTPNTEEEIIEEEEPQEAVNQNSENDKVEEENEQIEEVVEEEPEEVVEEYVEPQETYVEPTYQEPTYVEPQVSYGSCLTRSGGVYWFGDQKETWYNLDMSNIVNSIQNHGWVWNDIAYEYKQNVEGEYWIREDGCKMLGDYIMVASNLNVHPRGSLVMTSLGMGVVVDTGGFAVNNPLQIDIATNW